LTYYAFTTFISAFLLFQIQPIISKYILPWFGGTPTVWSTSILFFQVFLLGGYAYTYLLIDKLNARKQGIVHLTLLGSSVGLFLLTWLAWESPITPDTYLMPYGTNLPVLHILMILAISVGPAYFMLSTNTPIMQAWFNYAYPGKSPYRLYAFSNASSLLALISYPFLVEPALELSTQANLWSLCYIIFVICIGYGALRVIRMNLFIKGKSTATEAKPSTERESRPSAGIQSLWIILTACASVMLLATTSQISHEVAVVPFFWILPLTLYLLSFILCFSSEWWYPRNVYAAALFVSSILLCFVLSQETLLNTLIYITVYSFILFICCMICHGELVRLKPHPRYLTSFYMMVATGGAIGGIAVNFIAPCVFTDFWEFQLGLLGCWVILLITSQVNKPPGRTKRVSLLIFTMLLSFTIMLGSIFFLYIQDETMNLLEASRNFYGVLKVKETNHDDPSQQAYILKHSTTVHGFQYTEEVNSHKPTTYYTERSGVGLAILHHPKREVGLRIGIIGLGVGTLAAYGRMDDTIRFYEINPDVIRLAEGAGGYFSYLKDCQAQVEVVQGDARISLEQELNIDEPQHFDLLIIDAFSSVSIPIHLLTKEAFNIYLQHLQPDGVLAFHISHRHLDLWPVIWKIADYFQLNETFSTCHQFQNEASSRKKLPTFGCGLMAIVTCFES
jgi:spermidine synthase